MDRCPTCGAKKEIALGDNSFFACKGYRLCDGTHFCPSSLAKERDEMIEFIKSINSSLTSMGCWNCDLQHQDGDEHPRCACLRKDTTVRLGEHLPDCPIAKFVNERGKA